MSQENETMESRFANPAMKHRSAPFWSWNDWLKPEELRWQIDEMKKAGFGGFFMHSRYGLETPFLREDWWKAIDASVDEARTNGMYAWIYDEDRWPSGTAGGLVTRNNPELGAWQLQCFAGAFPEGNPAPLATYRLRSRGKKIVSAEPVAAEGARADSGVVHVVAKPYAPTPWLNDSPYLDVMSGPAVRSFIEVAFEPYRARYEGEFGKTIPGIFTDEPNYLNHEIRGVVLPWTPDFEAIFEAEHGYAIRPMILGLFYETPGFRKTRHDFFKTTTRLFVENYSKQLGEWCGRHNLMLTGHFLLENTNAEQTLASGASMPHYEHQQLPGMDLLCNRIEERATAKQVSSVGHQFGRKRMMSELYGVTSWDYPFVMQKWQGDWHYVMGINFRCQHLALYSLRGGRKRDYPQSYLYQSPWWPYSSYVEDYFARLSYILAEGEFASDVLLIHNISSTHCEIDPADKGRSDKWFPLFDQTMIDLFGLHRDFDLGDESIMSRHGAVEGKKLRVAQKAYSAVVVPPALNLRGSTLDLLERFTEAGGTVVAIRPTPTLLDGEWAQRVVDFFRSPKVRTIAAKRGPLARALDDTVKSPYSLKAKGDSDIDCVYSHGREIAGETLVFLTNSSREKSVAFTLEFPGPGTLRRWNAATGQVVELCSKGKASAAARVEIGMAPMGSDVISWKPGAESRTGTEKALREVGRDALYGPWDVELTAPNALTLDDCAVKIEQGEWSEPVYTRLAARKVFQHYGFAREPGNGDQQPWARREKGLRAFPAEARVALRFAFSVASVPAGPVRLAIESPERFAIEVNGQAIASSPQGWFFDKSFKTIEIGGAIAQGRNEIVITAGMAEDLEIESLYIVGDFGVDRWSRHIVEPTRRLRIGDWVDQGLTCYAGAVRYKETVDWTGREGERLFVELKDHRDTAVAVHVNGQLAGVMGWEPYSLDVTATLKPGKNELAIELVDSGRNLLGPHYHRFRGLDGVCPDHFNPEAANETEPQLVAYGLSGPIQLVRKK